MHNYWYYVTLIIALCAYILDCPYYCLPNECQHYTILFSTGQPQWEFMHGLMENAIYGGRVDNTFDMRVLITYLEQCFDEFVITGQAATPVRPGKKKTKLPFGNIPVSVRVQVGTVLLKLHQ